LYKTDYVIVSNYRWVEGPQLILPRWYHSCGVMNWMDPITEVMEKVIVVAGIVWVS
jgi:hypothetical protein